MVKLMVPVVRDLIAERKGIESMVGQSVEVVKKIPKNSRILVSAPGMGTPKYYPLVRDVYLVNSSRTRWMRGKSICRETMVVFGGYVGNDIYSAEELGL